MASSLGFGFGVLHADDAAEDFGEVDGFDGDAAGFEQFLAVADGVERRGARADGADAEAAQAADDAADGGEPGEILGEDVGIGGFGVQRGERVGNAVLLEVVAGATSCRRSCRGGRGWSSPGVSGVACTSTGTSRSARRRVSAMARSSPKFGSVTMMPSISSRRRLKRSAQMVGLSAAFDGAELGLFGADGDYSVARFFDGRDHLRAAALRPGDPGRIHGCRRSCRM